ncbi:MAG: nitrous oxide reductase family maturation protein NosD [Pseudomonadota bacterium]|nr:nitrous oxide reductase family maturation protein NosD [Pseudomonadota bacterium]
MAGALFLATGIDAAAQAQSLQQAIAAARPGAVVTIASGVHHGRLRIDKPLTLTGVRGAVLDGDGRGDVIRIVAPHVTVKGLTLRDSGTDLTAMNAGIYVEKQADGAELIGNRLEGVLFGIYLDGASGTKVIGNRIRGIARLRRADRGDGIHLWNDRGTLVEGNDIAGTRDGIYIYISPQTRIVGNRLHGVRYGIHYMYSNDDEVAGNVSFGNVAGYALMQSHNLRVHNNSSSGDRDYGFLLNYVTFSRFRGNTVKHVQGETGAGGAAVQGAEGKGIFVYNSEYDRFSRNIIADCPIGIHVTAGSDHDVFDRNAFLHNRVQVKYVQNTQEEWSWRGVGNYWSDYLGWDMNGDGIGDVAYRPNDGIDILLWEYPDAALLMNSPAILALRYVQRAFPIFVPPGVADSHPLMKRPAPAPADGRQRYAQRG